MASLETQRTYSQRVHLACDPCSLERGVRQLLADKVSGTLLGIWLLIPEHLRLGTWDLLRSWTGQPTPQVETRLALQLVHEAALCVTGIRQTRSLSQKGFEVANGLPFVATDQAIHNLLQAHTVDQAQTLQIALGLLRRSSGHFQGRLLAIDPHRLHSYSQRQMIRRKQTPESQAFAIAQTFFCFDVETGQPIAFTSGSSARTVSQATPVLLDLTAQILQPTAHTPLILADTEHFTAELFDHVARHTPFQLLVPASRQQVPYQKLTQLDPATFTPRWAGFATAVQPYHFRHSSSTFHQLIQRCGETQHQYVFKAFLATGLNDEVTALCEHYPQRWHLEEFFNLHQALGWQRAGTHNLHIRYGHMTMALLAQACLEGLRRRLGDPFASWEAGHLAKQLLAGLDGDLRIHDDTILVTFYNAPNAERLRAHYEQLPAQLQHQGVDPRIPWLFDLKLDFRFR